MIKSTATNILSLIKSSCSSKISVRLYHYSFLYMTDQLVFGSDDSYDSKDI